VAKLQRVLGSSARTNLGAKTAQNRALAACRAASALAPRGSERVGIGIALQGRSRAFRVFRRKLMTKISVVPSILFALVCGSSACTTNVENPTVNQTGRSVETCTKSCDDTKTTCVGKCTDDGCKGSCTTTHDSCVSSCNEKSSGAAGKAAPQAGSGSTTTTTTTTVTCTKSCDDTTVSCSAKCTDDSCKASCTTQHDDCLTKCK
jgi:hypothetical protein